MDMLVNRTKEIIAEDYLAAKKLFEEAKKTLAEMEEELISVLETKDEGSKTTRLNGFKVDLKFPVNRSVDWDEFDKAITKIKIAYPDFTPPVKNERKLDEAGLKWYRDNEPGHYAIMAKAVTAKPGKVGVTVVRTE